MGSLSLSKVRIISITGLKISLFFFFFSQLEDLEVTVSDHLQKVLKPNFAAAWEEVGDDFEKEETFALSSIKTLDGERIPHLLVTHLRNHAGVLFRVINNYLEPFSSSISECRSCQ